MNKNSNRLGGGILLLVIGFIFLLRNFGLHVPYWVISWHTILIAIGLLIGYRRNFRGNTWMVMVLIGSIFTLRDILDMSFSQYYLAAGFILMGLYLLFRPNAKARRKEEQFTAFSTEETANTTGQAAGFNATTATEDQANAAFENTNAQNGNDFIDAVSVFGGSKQQVFSKNFLGGDIVAVLGGCDVNLTQADFEGTVTLEIIAILGGVKIVIPPSWVVKTEVTPIFGGVDDKRSVPPMGVGPHKILIIKGIALFGGVDIRNY